jgi:hypothetical protein
MGLLGLVTCSHFLDGYQCLVLAFGLTPLIAGGFVRVVTSANFPNGPTPLAQALALVGLPTLDSLW